MTPREIRTDDDQVQCAVCGRSLLRGEEPEPYLHDGRAATCASCAPAAPSARAGSARPRASRSAPAPRRDRRGLDLALAPWQRSRPPHEPRSRRPDAEAPTARWPTELRASPHARRGAVRARRGTASATSTPSPPCDELKMRARSSSSTPPSTRARWPGWPARSGAPRVAVLPVENSSLGTVTVAWELCWYRYEVDLADERGGVRVAGQGYELEELTEQRAGRQRGGRRPRRSCGRADLASCRRDLLRRPPGAGRRAVRQARRRTTPTTPTSR